VLPAGRYATLTYVNHSRRANSTLLTWVHEQGLELDRTESTDGDRFGCRYEAYLTDPRSERMKTRWHTELAIRLAGEPA
jgi:effector-binding domain-containing protein